jgi:hypothetical protein
VVGSWSCDFVVVGGSWFCSIYGVSRILGLGFVVVGLGFVGVQGPVVGLIMSLSCSGEFFIV